MKTEIIFNKQPTDNTVYKEKVFDVVLSGGSPQGLSAYQLAVKNGFQGTEQEWLNSLRGYIPEKGVDYWTEEDKNQIFNLIPQWPLADRLAKGTAEGAIKEGAILYNTAVGENSHAEGRFTTASGDNSHAEGSTTSAAGERGHAEGTNTVATGDFSHAQGESTRAMNKAQSVGGRYNEVDPSQNDPDEYGTYVEIIGNGTGSSNRSNARTLDWSGNEILAGKLTIGANPINDMDVATKKYVDENSGGGFDLSDRIAKGTGNGAVIQGQIDGISANNASGNLSFAQGIDNTASGPWSHAEGNGTTAYGYNSHSEGGSTIANGTGSHAEGDETRADGSYSHSEGRGTITAGRSQHVSGEYNIADNSAHVYDRGTYVEIIGNGLDNENRSNARTLDWNGNEVLKGKLTVGAAPTENMDVATKKYVDDGLSNIDFSDYTTQTYVDTELAKKQDTLPMGEVTSADIGKALMPKTVENGEVTSWEFGEAGMVDDVTINGTSIVNNKVAEIPIGSSSNYGVIRPGAGLTSDGVYTIIAKASNNQVKAGAASYSPIVPNNQHRSVFYGLTKAAGVDMASSSNSVGTYTDAAKTAIQSMLGIDTAIASAVGQITGFDFSVVQELPVSGVKGVIYLVAHSHGDNDGYDEYIWINNGFEKLGHCDIDLTDYATIDYVDNELENKVDDVQVNGTSVVSGGVANVPVASGSLGVVRKYVSYGIDINNGNLLLISPTNAEIKAGQGLTRRAIMTHNQHQSTFYGLAKAAGDTTQSASSNTVGNYTDNAKSAIKAMLGIGGETQTVEVSGTTPVITANQNTRYVCGEILSLDFTPSASGICDVIFSSGSTATVLTLPNTVILPSWFDATALDTDTTYEISISDGIYGAVMIW